MSAGCPWDDQLSTTASLGGAQRHCQGAAVKVAHGMFILTCLLVYEVLWFSFEVLGSLTNFCRNCPAALGTQTIKAEYAYPASGII